MQRRINGDDLRQSATLMKGHVETDSFWPVCEDYEIQGRDIVAKYPLPSCYPLQGRETLGAHGWSEYEPLEETPDLFIKFARLHKESSDFERAALEWSRKYGLPEDRYGEEEFKNKMPLALLWAESSHAWVVLTIYEAALRCDEQAVRSLLTCSTYRDDPLVKVLLPHLTDSRLANYLAPLMCVFEVSETTNDLCRQYLVPRLRGGAVPLQSAIRIKWVFRNLLGAMYLQMFWLMAAGDHVARCEYCGQTISHASPHPEGRKRRSDRRFCDDACRLANHRSKKKA